MNDRELRRYAAFGRTQTFCTSHAADFAAGSKALTSASRLGDILTRLDAQKATQASAGPTLKEVLLDALRLDLQNINRTARSIEQEQPGIAAAIRPPETSGQGALLTAADTILLALKIQPTDDHAAQAAKTVLLAEFVAHELPATFVQDLAEDRAAIDTAIDAEENASNDGVKSTAAIDQLVREGMKELTTLDAIMHNKYARVPEKLRAWQSASHIERAPQREKRPTVTVVTNPSSTPKDKAA